MRILLKIIKTGDIVMNRLIREFAIFMMFASVCILHADSNWNVPYGSWDEPNNWVELAVPTAADNVYISNGGTSVVDSAGNICLGFQLGNGTGSTGFLDIVSGDLVSSGRVDVAYSTLSVSEINMTGGLFQSTKEINIGFNGSGELNQSGGTNDFQTLIVAKNSAAEGVINLSSGQMDVGNAFYMGWGGKGTFIQSGGAMISAKFLVIGYGVNDKESYYHQTNGYSLATATKVGSLPGAKGRMDLFNTSEHVSVGVTYVGFSGDGKLNIYDSADFCVYNSHLYIGGKSGSTGVVNLVSGSLSLSNTYYKIIYVGDEGIGTLNLGNADTTGVVTNQRFATGGTLIVKGTASAEGTVNGWGDIGLYYILENNGRIIANGYGTDRALDMSNFTSFDNTIDNTTSNGWFAVNQGELILPDVAIDGAGSYNWGELSTDTTIDLVNSVELDLADGSGNLTGKLLASDRTDVPAGLEKVIGVWNFSGVTPTSAVLNFRYDDALAAEKGLSAERLAVYQFDDGSWVRITDSVDDVNKIITTKSVTTLSTFAVAESPAFGSVFIVK
jgi:hypothetical protein